MVVCALAETTGSDAYELECLCYRFQRYVSRCTNPPEEIVAGYIEHM